MRSILLAAAAVVGLGISAAHATFTVDITQDGSNVVATGSGLLDLAGLSYVGTGNEASYIDPSVGQLSSTGSSGSSAVIDDYYGVSSSPGSFGNGNISSIDASTGDAVGIGDTYLVVPAGFVSGASLSTSDTFDDTTFANLGLTPGTYTWTWSPPNETDDSFVVNIGQTAVPEPTSLALLGAGLLGLVGFARRRSRG